MENNNKGKRRQWEEGETVGGVGDRGDSGRREIVGGGGDSGRRGR